MKVLAVGDLHRKWGFVERILFFAKQNGYKKVVFTGDYADDFRGNYEDTIKLWNMMLCPPRGYKRMVVPLMGNHDFAYAFALEMKMMFGDNNVQTGFDMETLKHIDMPYMEELGKKFLLQTSIEGVLYTHAGMTSDWVEKWLAGDIPESVRRIVNIPGPMRLPYMYFADQTSPIWARFVEEEAPRFYTIAHPKQVFGHTPVKTCTEFEDGCWCIDTFSTDRWGNPIGDRSLLEIEDGRNFRVIPEEVWRGK